MNSYLAFKNYLIMSRPLNILIVFLSVLLGGILVRGLTLPSALIMAGITAMLIAAGGNIINDIYDLEIDKINKPSRLLPSGRVSLRTAWFYFLFSYLCGLSVSLTLGTTLFTIAVIIAVLLYFYSFKLKRTILFGNIAVSLSGAMAFIYGAGAVGSYEKGVFPALFALLFHFGREVIKDMQDVEGDLNNQAITFAGKFGKHKSVILINFVYVLLIIITIIPYILNIYNRYYLWIVVGGVDLILLLVNVLLWIRNDGKTLGRLSHLLKLDMLIGLIALYVG